MKKYLVGSLMMLAVANAKAGNIYNYTDKQQNINVIYGVSFMNSGPCGGSQLFTVPAATISTTGEIIPSAVPIIDTNPFVSSYINCVQPGSKDYSVILNGDDMNLLPTFVSQYLKNMSISKIVDTKIEQYDQKLSQKLAEMQKTEESHLAALDTNVEAKVNDLVNNSDLVSTAVNSKLDDTKASTDGSTQLENAVKNNFNSIREQHYADTTLPSGTFYIKSTTFTQDPTFKVYPAQLSGNLNCGLPGQSYFVNMKDASKSDTIVSQLLSAYVTDSKVSVDTFIQDVPNNGSVCVIKSVTIEH